MNYFFVKNLKRNVGTVLALFLLLFFDQYTKRLAVIHLKDQSSFVLIDRVLEFSYLENTGAAFSSFAGRQTFLILLTSMVILVVIWKYFTLPAEKRFAGMRIGLLFIAGGAVGNLIDRITQQYVVDFIYFVPIDFPKFNVADIYITIGVALLAVLLFFYYNDEEFEALLAIRQKHADK
ncbi:signal peptidase II [bacterium 0.1xD8-71]|nr:signal peptidase II [bacterium 0.1xD8-71]